MRKIRYKIAAGIVSLCLLLSGCGNNIEAAQMPETSSLPGTSADSQEIQVPAEPVTTDGAATSEEDLAFPPGAAVSGNFTGDVYFAAMIRQDDIYHFPQTNHLTFAPGARSYWHSHGGMILLGTGGSGYYQIEGEAVQGSIREMWRTAHPAKPIGTEPVQILALPIFL